MKLTKSFQGVLCNSKSDWEPFPRLLDEMPAKAPAMATMLFSGALHRILLATWFYRNSVQGNMQ